MAHHQPFIYDTLPFKNEFGTGVYDASPVVKLAEDVSEQSNLTWVQLIDQTAKELNPDAIVEVMPQIEGDIYDIDDPELLFHIIVCGVEQELFVQAMSLPGIISHSASV